MTQNNWYVICYPGGSGGSFLTAALNAAVNNKDFFVDEKLGHCHKNVHSLNHSGFEHGPSIYSFRQELNKIESLLLDTSIFSGHYRNIVALREKIIDTVGYNDGADTVFVKITVDYRKSNEIQFVASMLQRKKNCFTDLPLEEYLNQTKDYIKSWYWIENAYTLPNTITLTLSDIFLNKVSSKLLLPTQATIKLDQCQNEYLNIQNQLHRDLIQLLHEQ